MTNNKGPLRRPVKTTRIVIAVGGPRTDCCRSQLRRLGFGQPYQARPRHGCANIPCGSQADPQNRNFLLWWEPELPTLVRHSESCLIQDEPGGRDGFSYKMSLEKRSDMLGRDQNGDRRHGSLVAPIRSES